MLQPPEQPVITFSVPLLKPKLPLIPERPQQKNSVAKLIKDTSLFGLRNLISSVGYSVMIKIIAELGHSPAAALSIISPLQGVLVSACTGYLNSVGNEIATARTSLASEKQISNLIKTSFVNALLLGTFSGLFCCSTRLWLPLLLANQQTAYAAVEYMESYSVACIADCFLTAYGQTVFKMEENSWFGVVTTTLYRSLTLPLGYYLGVMLRMNMHGIGAASSITGILLITAALPWFYCRRTYRDLDDFLKPAIDDFKNHSKKLRDSGWKFAVFRLTEWINLFAIAQIIGNWSNDELFAVQLSMVGLSLTSQLLSGLSQGGMLIAKDDCAVLKKAMDAISFNRQTRRENIDLAQRQLLKVKKNLIITVIAGLLLNTLLVGIIYYWQDALLKWCMPNDTPDEIKNMAKKYLNINFIGTFPEAIRVLTASPLQGWNDILFPTFNSLICMTIIGVPLAVGIGLHENKNVLPFFWVRIGAIAVAASINLARNIMHIRNCSKQLNSYSNGSQSIRYAALNTQSYSIQSEVPVSYLPVVHHSL